MPFSAATMPPSSLRSVTQVCRKVGIAGRHQSLVFLAGDGDDAELALGHEKSVGSCHLALPNCAFSGTKAGLTEE